MTATASSPSTRDPAPPTALIPAAGRPTRPQVAPAANGWTYRPHYDGLRAVAVYLVVLFHAGSYKLQGGFIGVDVFFVLSGFLVTNVLLSDLVEHGRVRFARFYARRARRLIPASAVAVVGTSAAAVLVVPQLERSGWTGDARAASLWYANWHTIAAGDNYFDENVGASPFLHFWSLSIEEQFYLAFPVILVTGLWVARRRLEHLAVLLTGLTMAGVVWQIGAVARFGENRAYMGTDTRAYQLLAGASLAVILWRFAIPRRLQPVGRWLGPVAFAVLLATATWLFGPGPSARGLAATSATVMLIAAFEAGRGSWLHRLLGWRPVRTLGQISYGTYLWHWPAVVLIGALADVGPLAMAIWSGVVGTALAALSHELVERDVRRARRLDAVPRAVIAGGVFVALLSGALLAPALLQSARQPSILVAEQGTHELSGDQRPVPPLDFEALRAHPDAPPCARPDGSDCLLLDGSGRTALVIGDSHAEMLIPVFEEFARRHDLRLYMAYGPSCPWQRDLMSDASDARIERCRKVRQLTYDELIPRLDPDVVLVAGFPRTNGQGALPFSERPDVAGSEPAELVARLTVETVETWVAEGRSVVLTEPIPTLTTDQLACLSGAATIGACAQLPVLTSVEELTYRVLAGANDRVVALDLDHDVCPRLPVCDAMVDDLAIRRDSNHLTAAFAERIADSVVDRIDAGLAFGPVVDVSPSFDVTIRSVVKHCGLCRASPSGSLTPLGRGGGGGRLRRGG